MSRTYRLRHERSRVAGRFVDGTARRYINKVDNSLAALVVYGVYGRPPQEGDYALAKPFFCSLAHMLGGWDGADQVIDVIAGDKKYAVAGVGYHEYARAGRSSASRAWFRKPKRSRKLCNRKILAKATKQGDFDGDWDVDINQRSRGVYA